MTLDELKQRITVTVSEAASALGVSRPVAYELCRRGEIPTIGGSGGRRVVVPVPALLTMLGAQPTDGKVITAEQLIVALEAAARALRQSIGE